MTVLWSWLSTYRTVLGSGLRSAVQARGAQRRRRVVFVLLFVTLYPFWTTVTALCLGLDRLLFARQLAQPISKPIFIVGNHRTGSTFLQRLLAGDSDTFACARLWDLLLPALVQKRCVRALGQIDGWVGAPLGRGLRWLDARWGLSYRRVHPMGLWMAEEDEFWLLYSLQSAALWECFPDADALRPLFWSDTDLPPDALDHTIRVYAQLAKRTHIDQPGRLWLSKNPLFSGRITGLRRVFPDARFIVLTRNPLQVVPSTASLIHHAQRAVGARADDEVNMVFIHEICRRFYDEPPQSLAGLPPEQVVFLAYEDLKANLADTLRTALQQLQVPVSDALEHRVMEATQRTHRSTHHYALDDWGLTAADITEQYAAHMPKTASATSV